MVLKSSAGTRTQNAAHATRANTNFVISNLRPEWPAPEKRAGRPSFTRIRRPGASQMVPLDWLSPFSSVLPDRLDLPTQDCPGWDVPAISAPLRSPLLLHRCRQ